MLSIVSLAKHLFLSECKSLKKKVRNLLHHLTSIDYVCIDPIARLMVAVRNKRR